MKHNWFVTKHICVWMKFICLVQMMSLYLKSKLNCKQNRLNLNLIWTGNLFGIRAGTRAWARFCWSSTCTAATTSTAFRARATVWTGCSTVRSWTRCTRVCKRKTCHFNFSHWCRWILLHELSVINRLLYLRLRLLPEPLWWDVALPLRDREPKRNFRHLKYV